MTSEENREPEDSQSSNEEELEQAKKAEDKRKDKSHGLKPTLEEKLSSKMLIYAREVVCFFLAVTFTALAAMHSSPPRVSKPPIARPFFNESFIVLDYYKGHLSALVDRVTDSDFSFVMYYAPWDAESQAIKHEFESAARYYHSQVFFAAINCWHPGSECRARYSKIQSYPVLMLYPSKESGVQYRGIRTAPYMIRFIHNFLNPIKRARTDEELMDLLKSYDAVMIGYFRFWGLKSTPGYKQFYRASLQMLEKDPNSEIAFVVITSQKTASDHGVTQFPAASLLMWNETLFYPDSHIWTADNLSNWINNVVHRVVTWLQPPGSKSLTFAPYLWDGPVLFLFTPRNPLYPENDNYNLLREIGLQYYDCTSNPQIQNLILRLRQSRLEAALKAYEKREWCINLLEEAHTQRSSFIEYTIRNKAQHRWSNDSAGCCSDIPTNKCISCSRRGREEEEEGMCAAPGAVCRGADLFGQPVFVFEDHPEKQQHSERLPDSDVSCAAERCNEDPHSATAVRRTAFKRDCRRFLASYSYQRPLFPKDPEPRDGLPEVNLTEAICKINKTLALVAIDSLHYFHFAEGLGIDIGSANDKTAVVIMDPSDESQFVMQEEFGRDAFVKFINNYTNGYLRRNMRSNSPKRFVRSIITKNECNRSIDSQICVPELSSETFLDNVLDPDKDVVVLYYSPYCAFCSAVAYVYLTIAQYLAKMDHLEFVRIDGDNNDLPWEYTMTRYPSIIFFPARRKEDSTLFPWSLPVSVGNLLSFVLANLDEESHVEALMNLCAGGAAGSSADCLERVRGLNFDVIESHLGELRRLKRLQFSGRHEGRLLERRRRELLLRLNHARQVHLLLGTSNDLSKDTAKVRLLRRKFQRFYKKLSSLRSGKIEIKHRTLETKSKSVEQRAS